MVLIVKEILKCHFVKWLGQAVASLRTLVTSDGNDCDAEDCFCEGAMVMVMSGTAIVASCFCLVCALYFLYLLYFWLCM